MVVLKGGFQICKPTGIATDETQNQCRLNGLEQNSREALQSQVYFFIVAWGSQGCRMEASQ